MVYLIIPPELDGTNRIKLGRSKSNTDDRINSYGKDTKVLHRISVNNSIFIEKRLKDNFKKLILERKIEDEQNKLSRKIYDISIEDQCKIKENIKIVSNYRTSKQEFLDFITLKKLNVSRNDLLKFLTSIPGIIYDKNATKKVKDRRDRGIFRGVLLKII